MTKKFDHKKFLSTMSVKPGVYQMLDSNSKVIYVGKVLVGSGRERRILLLSINFLRFIEVIEIQSLNAGMELLHSSEQHYCLLVDYLMKYINLGLSGAQKEK